MLIDFALMRALFLFPMLIAFGHFQDTVASASKHHKGAYDYDYDYRPEYDNGHVGLMFVRRHEHAKTAQAIEFLSKFANNAGECIEDNAYGVSYSTYSFGGVCNMQGNPVEKYGRLRDAVQLLAATGKGKPWMSSHESLFDSLYEHAQFLHNAARKNGEGFLCMCGNDRLIQNHLANFLQILPRPLAEASTLTVPRGEIAPVTPGGYPLKRGVWDALEKLKETFEWNNGVVYIEDVLPAELHERLLQERDRLWRGGASLIVPSCFLNGVDRFGGFLHQSTGPRMKSLEPFYEFIYSNADVQDLLSALAGSRMYPSDMPLALRRYGKNSNGMDWHRDLVVYENPLLDFEIVYTLDNHGSSRTDFVNKAGISQQQLTKANSLMVVRANSAWHMVTPSGGGSRDIIKGIYSGTMRHTDVYWQLGVTGGNIKEHTAQTPCPPDHPNKVGRWTKGFGPLASDI